MLTWNIEILNKILSNGLTALYQPFWFSVLSAVLFMFFCMYAKEHGWKTAVYDWLRTFKTSGTFRRTFCLTFYTMMILMRTLLNRNMWANPLSDVMGGWTLYDSDGELTTEAIENVMLMLPFTVLLLWALREKLSIRAAAGSILWKGTKYAFLLSVTIEFAQLFLRLGTFQISDIFYNTLGGFLGSIVCYIGCRVKHKDPDIR